VARNSPEERSTFSDEDRLIALLRRLGATDDEVRSAFDRGAGGDFAVELALRTGPPLTLEQAATAAGTDVEEFLRFWRALGLAIPPPGAAVVPADLAAAAPIIGEAVRAWIGEEGAFGIARVLGATSARIAEAIVDAFRLGFEVPELSAGTDYASVIEQYVTITRTALPPFQELLVAVIKAHLVRVASDTWAPDADNQATRRTLFVGFADLVGYTALARTLSPAELAGLLGRFEDLVADVVTTGGGRLVKLIGDGAMFVADTAQAGCAVALALCERLAGVESLPPARVGADYGSVLGRSGDYFGDVVNRAARLVALANPATVVVSDSVADALDRNSFGLERLPAQALKGFQAPAVTYRLLER
jgi:class 3 adenylate cyclase